ncbi:hypothetical protein Q9233_016605 [Columba guinea]|nr:hypothetical protein Q9233_016605 [Columba guinea]
MAERLRVSVLYCTGVTPPPQCRFQYQQLKQELERRFPGALEVNGDGFVDTDAKLHKIMAAIKTQLAQTAARR